MDSITQAALGAVVGQVTLGRQAGLRGAVWGAFFGTLPDLDIFFQPLLDEAAALRWHRGLSHSLLVMVLGSLLLARPFARILRRYDVTPRQAGYAIFWMWSTHVLIDCFNEYGTQVFEPFSDHRVGFGNLFIIDPLFTLPMIIGLIFCVRLRHNRDLQHRMVWQSITASGLYVLFSFIMQGWASQSIKERMQDDLPDGKLVVVSATAFNTLLWRGLIESDRGFYITYWSPFDRGSPHYDYIEKQADAITAYQGAPVLDSLKWFSEGKWVARKGEGGKVILVDMRFGEIRDPANQTMRPIFQWHLGRNAQGVVQAPMHRPKKIDYSGALKLIATRITGTCEEWETMKEF